MGENLDDERVAKRYRRICANCGLEGPGDNELALELGWVKVEGYDYCPACAYSLGYS